MRLALQSARQTVGGLAISDVVFTRSGLGVDGHSLFTGSTHTATL